MDAARAQQVPARLLTTTARLRDESTPLSVGSFDFSSGFSCADDVSRLLLVETYLSLDVLGNRNHT